MAQGAHDGYRRLPGAPVHHRSLTLDDGGLEIEDRLTGTFGRAESRLHLHPDVGVADRCTGDATCLWLRLPEGRVAQVAVEGGRLRIEPSTWHPRFGERVPTCCLVADFAGPVLRTRIEWSEAS
jgi:uncharacterized heparinase superfamily protein